MESWKGVDVDKYMDEVKGRESDDLEEAAEMYANSIAQFDVQRLYSKDDFIAGAEWQKKHLGEAVETCVDDLNGDIYNRCIERGLTGEDKVKVIILKDDDYQQKL